MRLALLFLILMLGPALAQETQEAPQVFGTWQVEPGNAKRAATIEFTRDENLSYGFSCWKNHWLFFFNYQAPQGGQCEDSEECESDISEADLTFQILERPDETDQFTLFENYYFQDENLSVVDMEAMLKANRFRLVLNDKLKTVWQTGNIDFPLDGFEKTVGDNKKTFSCALHEAIPTPPERPDAKLAAAKVKPEKAVSAKSKKLEAKHAKVKKSKAARAKAAKRKLPSHALKKKTKNQKNIRPKRRR